MNVRPVGAPGVQRLDVAGADDLHRGGESGKIAILLLLLHLADANESPGNEIVLLDGALGGLDDPGEVLAGAELECDREVIGKLHPLRLVAQHPAPVVCLTDESLLIALFDEPI